MEIPSLESSIYSEVFPPEEGVDRFRKKEDEETPLPILPSGSHGITATGAYIFTLSRKVIAVDDNK